VKIVVPYTNLHPATRMVMSVYEGVRYENVAREDAYRQLLHNLWLERETFVIVEHDIVVWPGAIEELHDCMGRWCSCSYRLFGGVGVYHGLGCTKISDRLISILPGLWDEPCPWDMLDQRLWFAAREVGQEPHCHRPPVIHLNAREYPNAASAGPA
jgi:hypothetical protein